MQRRKSARGHEIVGVLAHNLRLAMQFAGVTGDELARLSGVGSSTISRMLRGANATSIDNLAAVAQALGFLPWQLLMPGFDPVRQALKRQR